jgi:hypothetical protein
MRQSKRPTLAQTFDAINLSNHGNKLVDERSRSKPKKRINQKSWKAV